MPWRDEDVQAESVRMVKERAMWELSKLVSAAPGCVQGEASLQHAKPLLEASTQRVLSIDERPPCSTGIVMPGASSQR